MVDAIERHGAIDQLPKLVAIFVARGGEVRRSGSVAGSVTEAQTPAAHLLPGSQSPSHVTKPTLGRLHTMNRAHTVLVGSLLASCLSTSLAVAVPANADKGAKVAAPS